MTRRKLSEWFSTKDINSGCMADGRGQWVKKGELESKKAIRVCDQQWKDQSFGQSSEAIHLVSLSFTLGLLCYGKPMQLLIQPAPYGNQYKHNIPCPLLKREDIVERVIPATSFMKVHDMTGTDNTWFCPLIDGQRTVWKTNRWQGESVDATKYLHQWDSQYNHISPVPIGNGEQKYWDIGFVWLSTLPWKYWWSKNCINYNLKPH